MIIRLLLPREEGAVNFEHHYITHHLNISTLAWACLNILIFLNRIQYFPSGTHSDLERVILDALSVDLGFTRIIFTIEVSHRVSNA